ncbi:uncharacterized protein L203_104191 [Cryptococcus depauperatus CBS 7841]|uniref:Uncharacterized protein n=1 Tax=Cryptococcus depauperatus CBS 7841 TaxID=1295531 RepID=A0A1E3HJ21_9TREE|nr:hypothetical protein L203_06498 [Cryptococcus depauperatus CBS 7841]
MSDSSIAASGVSSFSLPQSDASITHTHDKEGWEFFRGGTDLVCSVAALRLGPERTHYETEDQLRRRGLEGALEYISQNSKVYFPTGPVDISNSTSSGVRLPVSHFVVEFVLDRERPDNREEETGRYMMVTPEPAYHHPICQTASCAGDLNWKDAVKSNMVDKPIFSGPGTSGTNRVCSKLDFPLIDPSRIVALQKTDCPENYDELVKGTEERCDMRDTNFDERPVFVSVFNYRSDLAGDLAIQDGKAHELKVFHRPNCEEILCCGVTTVEEAQEETVDPTGNQRCRTNKYWKFDKLCPQRSARDLLDQEQIAAMHQTEVLRLSETKMTEGM